MIEATPSITKNAMRIKVSERTPLNGHNSSTTPTAIPRIAETSDHQKPGAWRIRKVVIKPTIILIAFFVIEGVASIMFALEHKRELSGRWGWMLASGVIDLILAAMILAGLPGTAAWALGLLVGINMVFGGAALIGMALHAREIGPRSPAPAH